MDVIGPDTVTLIHREVAGQDRYGNDVMMATETVVPGCSMQPMWGQESVGAADEVTDRFQLYLPGLALTDLDIDPLVTDAVKFRGITYEVNGEPQPWWMDGYIHHLVIFCRRSTG